MSATNIIGYPTRVRLAAVLRRPSVLLATAVVLAVAVIWGITLVRAAQPQTLDQRVNAIASQLQCPACNGESVADSSAVVAQEMRGVIQDKVRAGESDQQILSYFQQRYGDTILESPPKQGFTALVWLGPMVGLVAGLYIVFSVARTWWVAPMQLAGDASDLAEEAESLSAEERERYAGLLQQDLDLDPGEAVASAREMEGA